MLSVFRNSDKGLFLDMKCEFYCRAHLRISFDIKTRVKFYFIMISSSHDKKRETIRQSLWRKVLGWYKGLRWWWSWTVNASVLRAASVSRGKGFRDCRWSDPEWKLLAFVKDSLSLEILEKFKEVWRISKFKRSRKNWSLQRLANSFLDI